MLAALLRRAAFIAAVLAAGLTLTGCSPENIPAVTLSDNGVPTLVNCGTYFRGVEAYDADSGRLVWSAGKPDLSSGYGVGKVEVGLLPAQDWVEKSPLQMDPSLTRWRFVVVDLNAADPTTFEVASDRLSASQVFIFRDGATETSEHFRNDTCGYGPPGNASKITVILIVLGAIAGSFVIGIVGSRSGVPGTAGDVPFLVR